MKITKRDWQEVVEAMLVERRRELGPPPTFEEMCAYSEGALSEEGAARIRELFVCYPDELRNYLVIFSAPFPEERARPGEDGYVSDEEIEFRLEEHRRLRAAYR